MVQRTHFFDPTEGCGNLGSIANGTVTILSGSVVTFQCSPGFSLVGENISRCVGGQWTVRPEEVMCVTESSGKHNKKINENFMYIYIHNDMYMYDTGESMHAQVNRLTMICH